MVKHVASAKGRALKTVPMLFTSY